MIRWGGQVFFLCFRRASDRARAAGCTGDDCFFKDELQSTKGVFVFELQSTKGVDCNLSATTRGTGQDVRTEGGELLINTAGPIMIKCCSLYIHQI